MHGDINTTSHTGENVQRAIDKTASHAPAERPAGRTGLLCRRGWYRWRWLAAASWMVSLLLYITLPPSPDQFSHAYMGWRLLEGDVPYRDFLDQNWPGVMALHALAIKLFGVNLWSWRTFDFLLFVASAIALSDLIRRAVSRDAQKLSLLFFPLIYVGANYWIAGQQDMSATQFLVAALWFNVRAYERNNCRWQVGTGLFVALAMLNKPTVGVITVLFPLQALCLRARIRIILAHTTALAVSIFLILSAVFEVIIANGATGREIFDLLYTFSIARRNIRPDSIATILYGVLSGTRHPWWFPSLFASLPAVIWLLRSHNRTPSGVSLLSLWLTGLISYLIQGSGVGYHLAPAFIAMAAANTVSIYLVASRRMKIGGLRWQRNFGNAFIVATLAMIGLKLLAAYYTLPVVLATGDFNKHWARFRTGNGDVTVADTIYFIGQLHYLKSSDCILVLGNDSALNYLSRHRQPTRFYYFDVLANTRPPLPMAQQWLKDWDDDLRSADCPLVIISKNIVLKWLPQNESAQDSLRAFLNKYHEAGALGSGYGDILFRRNR